MGVGQQVGYLQTSRKGGTFIEKNSHLISIMGVSAFFRHVCTSLPSASLEFTLWLPCLSWHDGSNLRQNCVHVSNSVSSTHPLPYLNTLCLRAQHIHIHIHNIYNLYTHTHTHTQIYIHTYTLMLQLLHSSFICLSIAVSTTETPLPPV